MNNKGFTLIELVATIALLAVVSIISFVSINAVIEESKVSDCKNLVLSIKSATKEYVSDNRYNDIFNSVYDKVSIDASHLINGKYLSSPIVNPFDNGSNIAPSDIKIEIQLNNDYSVKEVTIGAPDILKECKGE
ncbi:MAG: prepilin-type N-terminal cleavage/methylation domain-containing protein [Bacilli bacterium]|nr:prepilin-type N-terminal cleavage/methylation domain-containing protein [Bacilli bacterium]